MPLKSYTDFQSWARGNFLASRQRQRGNVMELQKQEKYAKCEGLGG